MNAPNLRRRPLFVSGMPILWDTRDLKAETPRNLQIENPPRFMALLLLLNANPVSPAKTKHLPFADAAIVTEVHTVPASICCNRETILDQRLGCWSVAKPEHTMTKEGMKSKATTLSRACRTFRSIIPSSPQSL